MTNTTKSETFTHLFLIALAAVMAHPPGCSTSETFDGGGAQGTWVADASDITFAVSDGSEDAPQPCRVVDGELAIGGTRWAP